MIIKPFIFFIELLSDISRMISLSFRLFGNIVAKEVLLSVLVLLVLLFWPSVKSNALGIVSINGMIFSIAAILRPLIIWLGVLISVIQAGVFTLLTATYIAGAAVSHEEHSAE
jgi:F-type H+-transporting ATPase subunit a